MKRYAIVRVDGKCPDEFEKIDVQFTCRNLSCYAGKECYKNFYGDTKEQLIAKIEQVLQWERLCGAKIDDTVAEKIVEFLGVEE